MERDRDPAEATVAKLKQSTQPATRPAIDYDQESYSRGIRIILSGIARMHGRFGKAMIAQMLGGSNNKKIQQWKLNRLSTYGMLGGLKQPQLIELIDHLIEAGLASQTEVDDRRPTVKLTADGEAVMRASQPIPGALRIPYPLAKRLAFVSSAIEGNDVSSEASVSQPTHNAVGSSPVASGGSEKLEDDNVGQGDAHGMQGAAVGSQGNVPIQRDAMTVAGEASDATNQELIDRLKRWRGKTSAALGVPAYRVLSNATIERISQSRPQSTEELEMIQGVGPATIEQFGYDLMNILSEFETSAEAAPSPTVERSQPEPTARTAKSSAASSAAEIEPVSAEDAYWTWRLFRDGYARQQVCQIRSRDSAAVTRDLLIAAKAGHIVQSSWIGEQAEGDSVLRSSAGAGAKGEIGESDVQGW